MRGDRQGPSSLESYIIFLRHGDAALPNGIYPNHDTMGLSPLGRMQASEAARQLAAFRVTRLVASPLQRAQETAFFIWQATGVRIETDVRLSERVFAPLYGLTYKSISERFGEEAARAVFTGDSDNLSMDGVDDIPAYRDRVSSCMAELGDAGYRLTVVIAHGGPHEWYLTSILKLSDAVSSRRSFPLGKCRASVFSFFPGSPKLTRILGINLPVCDCRRFADHNMMANLDLTKYDENSGPI